MQVMRPTQEGGHGVLGRAVATASAPRQLRHAVADGGVRVVVDAAGSRCVGNDGDAYLVRAVTPATEGRGVRNPTGGCRACAAAVLRRVRRDVTKHSGRVLGGEVVSGQRDPEDDVREVLFWLSPW